MTGFTVGVVTTPELHADWHALALHAGVRPTGFRLLQELDQDWDPACWLVVLDPRHSPVPLKFWLKQLNTPLVLVTPYLVAAQTLCSWLPNLKIICNPVRAAGALGEVLSMALALNNGTLVLDEIELRSRERGGGA